MSNIKDKIKKTYSLAVSPDAKSSGCCGSAGCCGSPDEFTGFSESYADLSGYDPEADFGLGCGLPVEFADISEGDVVLDLGSGAGNDVFVARSRAGAGGRVIGVDMTQEMIDKANKIKEKYGYTNVEFILGDIENLPLPDDSVDVVISNCVLNLVLDKTHTYKHIFRVLRMGGHFSISDIVLSGDISEKMKNIAELYAGCISGAMEKSEYLQAIVSAGFKGVDLKMEKEIFLPDDFLKQYMTTAEMEYFRKSGVRILSITVNAYK
jgi:ubiquinone/menaquinone biosynthesis C-methylase UbiE